MNSYPKRPTEIDLPIADDIGNAETRRLLDTEDTLTASKKLKSWVEQGFAHRHESRGRTECPAIRISRDGVAGAVVFQSEKKSKAPEAITNVSL